ncbi:hypothetical protein Trydic_g1907 [Trypoxylus dichotomus]
MDVIINLSDTPKLKKQLVQLKPTRKDGLILQIHHTITLSKEKHQRVRFISICFNNLGQILAAATLNGDIYVVDFNLCKFWSVVNIVSCCILKFSSQNDECVIAGSPNGLLRIINIHTGDVIGKLEGHQYPVVHMSFSVGFLCVTSSVSEAIVWDLRNNSKIQVLSLSANTYLKQMLFMPVSNDLLACFNDDSIHMWKYGTFEYLKQITPASWNKFFIKCIAFAKNGQIMALGGHSSDIPIFSSDSWNLTKTISLHEHTTSVKQLSFISQPFDGGANRILSILSSNGIVYFYDMKADMLLSRLSLELEILRYQLSSDGKYLACIITCGRVNVYLLTKYLTVPQEESTKDRPEIKKISLKKAPQAINAIKAKINGVLDNEKLRSILNEFGQFPEDYRAIIWARLLRLPNNQRLYNALINIKPKVPIADFERKYPIESKMALKNLKKVVSNMANWSPFFAEVDYLPEFAFPFVKVFRNDPVACFEAVCTIVANWCQYWFEYFPLPPVNILAIIENVLLEHKPQLLKHFAKHNITSKIYAWPILQTVFSEVLTARDWLILWDHILINEPSFFLLAVVAFNLINTHVLLKMNYAQDIKRFFHTQNFLDIKKLISKTYDLLNNTSEKNHPRQYLSYFTPIKIGEYPQFSEYPAAAHAFQDLKGLRKDKHLLADEKLGMEQKETRTKIDEVKKNIEENKRINELENIYKSKLEDELVTVNQERKQLNELKKIKDSNLHKAIYRSLDHGHSRCYCTSPKGKHARLCDKAIIALDLKATDKLIKKVEKGLKKQIGGSFEDTDVRQLAAETVELEMKILKELQLLNSLKKRSNTALQTDDFALLKHAMRKIEDGYQGRNPSPAL